jgi:hypothetical protein
MLLINHAIYSVLVIAVPILLCNVIKVFSITIPFKNHVEVKSAAKTPTTKASLHKLRDGIMQPVVSLLQDYSRTVHLGR